MCLSGVDYFSTLGYQPGIAIVVAGALAPVATIILVIVTVFGAVPVYRRVARHSPGGMGSIALVERMTRGWHGKLIVLVLLGFAATDFMITITLSSADASAHLMHTTESAWQIPVTMVLILALAAVFFRGFKEAVSVAVVLVSAYLSMTFVVIAVSMYQLATHPRMLGDWWQALLHAQGNAWMLVLVAVIVFPKLALGLSGFETGVSVMPLIEADNLEERKRKARYLVSTSALVMCFFLITPSIVAATLIPAAEFGPGGGADGRALAWVAHAYLGGVFGTVYDYVTVAILWFAGASAMSGMLALIPKFLPRFGMAPQWAQRSRPMVAVLTVIALVITLVFRASVDAQSGAYATGVLVVITSGAVSVTLLSRGAARVFFSIISVVFVATTIANIIERPDGLRVAVWFILIIVVFSLASRAWRSYDLREVSVTLDKKAEGILAAHTTGSRLNLVPAAPGQNLDDKDRIVRRLNRLDNESVVFLEITLRDPSAFAEPLVVRGHTDSEGRAILAVDAANVANSLAVLALHIGRTFHVRTALYFEWAPGSPFKQMARYIFSGSGQVATVTHEILRRSVRDDAIRPEIHVA